MNLGELNRLIDNREELILWLIEKGLVGSIPICPACGEYMNLRIRSSRQYLEYRCVKRSSNPHDKTKSLVKNSWFHNANISMDRIMTITYMFAHNVKQYDHIIRESSVEGITTSSNTVADWLGYCQEVCIDWSLQHQSQQKLGGVGIVVKVEVAKIGKQRNCASRHVNGTWLFGMVEIRDGDNLLSSGGFRIQICKGNRRGNETLLPIVQRHIEVGTTVCSDEWRVSYRLTSVGFELFTDNPSNNDGPDDGDPFVVPNNCANNMTIHEFLWRRHVSQCNSDPFDYFLTCIKKLYDPNV